MKTIVNVARPLFAIGFAMSAAVYAGQLHAQSGADLRTQAEQAVTDGQPDRALALTEQLLAQDPDDFEALFLRALALSDLGDPSAAAIAAGQAYTAAQSSDERLQAARLAGGARFGAQHYTRAEWWLRRAANNATRPEDKQIVAQDFQNIRAQNPLSVQLSFSAAPSSNVNGGADDEVFVLGEIEFFGELEFILPPEDLALSGVEYAGDVDLSYRISQSTRQVTSLGIYAYGRTFTLSSEAQDSVPDVSGSDFALTLVEVSIGQRRLLADGLGPTSISAHVGKVSFGGDPLWDYRKLALGQEFAFGQTVQLGLQGSVQDQKALVDTQPDTKVYDVSGIVALQLSNQDQVQFQLTRQLNDADLAENTFTNYALTTSYRFDRALWGTRWTATAGIGYTNYDEFSLSLDGRRDTYATLGGTAVFEGVSYFGFSPSVTLSATQTESNVTRFSTTEIQGRVGIQSNF